MNQKVALVTAAGSGMGAGVARRLADDGYAVAVFSSSDKATKLAAEIGGIGIVGSNRDVGDITRCVEQVMAHYGRIDVVVNSAGHGPKGKVLAISDEDWHLGMEIYFLHAVRIARLVTPIMVAQGGGAIVNISTYATFEPDPAFPTSGAFRSSLAAFTKLFSDEYAAQNVRMNNLLPGFINSLPEKQQFLDRIPMERYGTVEEIAATASFLVSDGAQYITGQNIRVDGGITRAV